MKEQKPVDRQKAVEKAEWTRFFKDDDKEPQKAFTPGGRGWKYRTGLRRRHFR